MSMYVHENVHCINMYLLIMHNKFTLICVVALKIMKFITVCRILRVYYIEIVHFIETHSYLALSISTENNMLEEKKKWKKTTKKPKNYQVPSHFA